MYDPTLGRFLQRDPIGYADSMNLYAYVVNNPVNWVDPDGLMAGVPGYPPVWTPQRPTPFPGGTTPFPTNFPKPQQTNFPSQYANGEPRNPCDKKDEGGGDDSRWKAEHPEKKNPWSKFKDWFRNKVDDIFGKNSPWFNRNNGKFNKGSFRMGWGWKGSKNNGHDTWRIAIGGKNQILHGHVDIWPQWGGNLKWNNNELFSW